MDCIKDDGLNTFLGIVGALTLPSPMEVNAVRISMPVRGGTEPGALGGRGSHCSTWFFFGPGRPATVISQLSGMTLWNATLYFHRTPSSRGHVSAHTAHPSAYPWSCYRHTHVCPCRHATMAMAGLPPIEAAWAASSSTI